MTDVAYPHIAVNNNGDYVIKGTRITLTQLIAEKKSIDCSAEELHDDHPELALSQIYAALSFYYDNEELIDRQIEEEDREFEESRRNAPPNQFVERMKREGLI